MLTTEGNTGQSAPRILSTWLIVCITVEKKHIDPSVSGEFISAGHSHPQFDYHIFGSTRNEMQTGGIVGEMNTVDGSRYNRDLRILLCGDIDLK
jgi:hypothetical protein